MLAAEKSRAAAASVVSCPIPHPSLCTRARASEHHDMVLRRITPTPRAAAVQCCYHATRNRRAGLLAAAPRAAAVQCCWLPGSIVSLFFDRSVAACQGWPGRQDTAPLSVQSNQASLDAASLFPYCKSCFCTSSKSCLPEQHLLPPSSSLSFKFTRQIFFILFAPSKCKVCHVGYVLFG